MPQRTTEEAVHALCPTELPDISGPMRAGSRLADLVYSDAMTEDAELLERYLVAHFVAISDPRALESTFDGIRQKFESADAIAGLGETRFGRTALALDPTGELARRGAGKITLEVY